MEKNKKPKRTGWEQFIDPWNKKGQERPKLRLIIGGKNSSGGDK